MKKIVLMIVCLMLGMVASAQKTSLVIDNQTPGWLSSKINYGDQLTVQNLKVTGYLNQDDLAFITKLTTRALKGELDLEDCQIVNSYGDLENNLSPFLECDSIRKVVLPLHLKESKACLMRKSGSDSHAVFVDTLVCGGAEMPVISQGLFQQNPSYLYSPRVKHIIFRTGVEEIGDNAFLCWDLESIEFQGALKRIGKEAFNYCESLKKVNWKSVRSIEIEAFGVNCGFQPDTLCLPDSLVWYYTCSFVQKYKQVMVIPKSVIKISNIYGHYIKNDWNAENKWIIKNPIPPAVETKKETDLGQIVVYVPKGSRATYLKAPGFSGVKEILELPVTVTGVVVEPTEMEMEVGKPATIKASVLPADADNTSVVWSSSDETIAVVSASGVVTGKKSGTALITATSAENKEFKAVCTVRVVNPVKKVTLGEHELSLKAKETRKLTASVEPANADDGRVVWKSSDTKVVSVNNDGEITAVKAGKAFVFATAAANETIKDSCLVTVTQSVTGITLDKKSIHSSTIGEVVQLTATVLPDDADDKRVNWASSKPEVCTVSPSGAIVVLADGTSVVTATTLDGGFVAVCTVEVSSAGGVEGVAADDVDYTDAKWYDIDGREATYLKKGGVYIVKPKTGKAKKVVIR